MQDVEFQNVKNEPPNHAFTQNRRKVENWSFDIILM
jgi:hypothetical protein